MRLVLALCLMVWLLPASGRDLDGRYANSPHRAWYEAQLVPGGRMKGQSCCTVADGAIAEEDIREGQYWTQWTVDYGAGKILHFPWMPVPHDVVLQGPNPRGHPVVWWFTENGKPTIRCYAPGAGI